MKSSSRLLISFGIGIIALVIVTVVLVLTIGQGNTHLLPENTPEGVVQRYLLAIQESDYSKAYSYLAPQPTPTDYYKGSPQSFEYFVNSAQNAANTTWKANLGKVTVKDNTASVELTVDIFRSAGPLENPIHTNTIIFLLVKSGDNWLVTSPIDLYWIY